MHEERSNVLKDSLYELVFLLRQGNIWIVYFGVVNLVVDYLQLLSFSFSDESQVNWNFSIACRMH
jgi:hypothetical protein